MEKKGDVKKAWQRRYFVMVAPRTMFYFQTEEQGKAFRMLKTSMTDSLKAYAKGAIPITDASQVSNAGTVDGKKHCFSIKPKADHKRIFIMAAPSEEVRDTWMKAASQGEKFLTDGNKMATPAAPPQAAVVTATPTPTPQVTATVVVVMQPQAQPTPVLEVKQQAAVYNSVNAEHVRALLQMFDVIRSQNASFLKDVERKTHDSSSANPRVMEDYMRVVNLNLELTQQAVGCLSALLIKAHSGGAPVPVPRPEMT